MNPSRSISRRLGRLLFLQVCALALPSFVLAQAVSPTPASAAADARALAKYDKNKNGKLDADEVAAMRADEAKTAAIPVDKAAAGPGEEVVQLSPFEVQSDNKGYYASNTLSGTRINSSIEDLASSITVVTKQQMLDTAAVDINDIFLYEANTEGTGTYTAFSVGRNGDVNDSAQGSPMTANRVRGIESANIAVDNFASNSRIPIDSAFIDSVEISRGPNSNIFGLGNASGTVNLNRSVARLNRSTSQVQARVDSYGGYRASLDLNRPILRDKLALRLVGVYDSKAFVRKPSADITHRASALITYQPFKPTSLKVSYETYHNYARRPNSITPRDAVSYWQSAGKPSWDPTNFTAYKNGAAVGTFTTAQDGTLPLGLLSQGTGFYNRPSMFIDGGQVAFWTVNQTTNTANANTPNQSVRYLESGTDVQRLRSSTLPLFTAAGISNQSIYDWEKYNVVAPNYSQEKADIYTVSLDQTLLNGAMNKLFVQASWRLEDADNYNRNSFISGTSAVLYVDVNQKLLDGRPNPYYQRPYLGSSEPSVFRSPQINDSVRFQANYQLDFTKQKGWLSLLGRHTATGYNETRRITDYTLRHRLAVLDDHVWTSPANRANGNAAARAYFKYYLGDNNGQNVDYGAPALYGPGGTYNFNWLNGTTGQWISEPARFGETGFIPSSATRREVRSTGLVVQDGLWLGANGDPRFIGTWGVRRDKNRSRTANATLGADGFVNYANIDNHAWGSFTERQGLTRTQGGVFKPFRGWAAIDRLANDTGVVSHFWDFTRSLALSYNQSDSFQPASTAYNLFGEQLPDPTGHGKDYGITFNLTDKLYVTIRKYENTSIDSRSGDGGTIATRANRIDFATAGSNDSFNLQRVATDWVTRLNPGYTAQQTTDAVAKIMGLSPEFVRQAQSVNVAETSDVLGKGLEFEVNYNPLRNWSIKFTASQNKTIDDHLSPNIQRYIDQRMPIWTTVVDPITNVLWWTEGSASAFNFYNVNVLTPLRIAIANQGKTRSQIKEWRWTALTNYRVVEGRLRGLSVGGSVRWEDRSSIGFRGDPDADGVIRSLNRSKPVWDPARYYFDLSAGYTTKLFSGKVGTRFQLNVRNAFEGGRLQTVGVNPDGSPYNFRIVDPRQFILTTTFDL